MFKRSYFSQKGFIFKENKILLIKKSALDPSQPNKWGVPGGRMKFGEEIDDHIKREIFEEVGLEVNLGDPFFIWQWQVVQKNKNGAEIKIQIVAVARTCYFKSGTISFTKQEENECIEDYAWVRLSDIKKYNLMDSLYPVIDKLIETYNNRLTIK